MLPSAIVAVVTAVVFHRRQRNGTGVTLTGDRIAGLLLLTWVAVALGLVGTEYPAGGLVRAVYYAAGSAPYFLLCLWRPGTSELRRLGSAVAGVGALLGGLTCVEYLAGANPLSEHVFAASNPLYFQFVQHGQFAGRMLATIGHPVILGSILVLLFPMVVWRVTISKTALHRLLWLLATMAAAIGVLLTFSRGAWVALLVCLVALAPSARKSRLILVCAATAVVAVVLLVRLSPSVAATVELRDPVREYLLNFGKHERIRAYGQVGQLMLHDPLLGIGFGQYRFASHAMGNSLETPDNMYLMWLAETGILGLVAGVAVLAVIIRELGQGARDMLPIAIRAGVIAFAVNMLIADLLYVSELRLLFWTCVGIGLAAARQTRALDTPGDRP